MFGFNDKKQGNRKVKKARNLQESAKNSNVKPFMMALLISTFVISIVVINDHYKDQILFPITKIEVSGNLQNVTKSELETLVLNDLTEGFFNIKLNAIAVEIEGINWVAQATLRRVWPNKINVLIREHQAVAVWDERTLMSANGILFNVPSTQGYQQFARINGQVENAKELLLAYSQLEQLTAVHDLYVDKLSRVKSGEIQVKYNSSLISVFAMQDNELQFKRFASLLSSGYLKFKDKQNTFNNKPVKSIDLRYSNGFSVVWQEPQSTLIKRANTFGNGNKHV